MLGFTHEKHRNDLDPRSLDDRRRLRRPALVALTLALAGCATTGTPEPVVRVVEVKVPTPVPCVVNAGPTPDYPDTPEALKAAPDLFARVQLLLAGRVLRIAREAELRAAMKGCEG